MDQQPLAFRMRPKTLDDIIGQQHIIGKETPLYQSIAKGYVPSMLLYGPPGTGKTSIANAIAGSTSLPFFSLNATQSGKKDIEAVVKESKETGKVILFLDEIARFNKLQQDTLLPHVEDGSIILIGATTENPFHDVNPAIRSRCGQILQLSFLTTDDIILALRKALEDKENGFGKQTINISEESLLKIAESVNGDIRKALTILESVVYGSKEEEGVLHVKEETITYFADQIGAYSDKGGSHFYNLLSALQKSIRGSDVNAALYYLASLLDSGDLISACRRLVVIAFEDIGVANVNCATNVKAAVDTAVMVGLPEARIPLAKAVVEMCLSEKSNSAYQALDRAIAIVQNGHTPNVPNHLKDTHYKGSVALGHVGYQYPHDTPIGSFGGWVNQQYLPDDIAHMEFYSPVLSGTEQRMAKIYDQLKKFKQNES